MSRCLAVLILLFSVLVLGAVPALGAEEECDQLFPDLTCERSGRWEGFHKPIVSPYLFEDPFVTTGVYAYHIYHEFPDRSVLGGGHANVAAVQLRVALTDRIALIATKDGRAWVEPGLDVLGDRDRLARALVVEVDRLLAEDRLAGARRAFDQIGVAVRRACDQHGVDIGIGDRRLDRNRLGTMRGSDLLGRVGEASEVAALVTFLSSDRAGFITGVPMPIDGGMTASLTLAGGADEADEETQKLLESMLQRAD